MKHTGKYHSVLSSEHTCRKFDAKVRGEGITFCKKSHRGEFAKKRVRGEEGGGLNKKGQLFCMLVNDEPRWWVDVDGWKKGGQGGWGESKN